MKEEVDKIGNGKDSQRMIDGIGKKGRRLKKDSWNREKGMKEGNTWNR